MLFFLLFFSGIFRFLGFDRFFLLDFLFFLNL